MFHFLQPLSMIGADVDEFLRSVVILILKSSDVWEFQMQFLEINKSLSRCKKDNYECKWLLFCNLILWPEMHPQVLNVTECESDSNISSTYIKPCRDDYFNLIFLAKEHQRFVQVTV